MFVLLFPIAATKLLLFKNEVESLNYYKAITNILGSIEKKIEINKRKIEKLEAIADCNFDYWYSCHTT